MKIRFAYVYGMKRAKGRWGGIRDENGLSYLAQGTELAMNFGG
jgi:hypothetical protein